MPLSAASFLKKNVGISLEKQHIVVRNYPSCSLFCVCMCDWSWQTATAAAMGQLAVQLMSEVRMAAGTVPLRGVGLALWTLLCLLCLRAASDRGSTESASALLSHFLRSSSRTLHWERLMKSGLDLCSASCQNQKHTVPPDKTLKSKPPFPPPSQTIT